jgi:hypothetical protein
LIGGAVAIAMARLPTVRKTAFVGFALAAKQVRQFSHTNASSPETPLAAQFCAININILYTIDLGDTCGGQRPARAILLVIMVNGRNMRGTRACATPGEQEDEW